MSLKELWKIWEEIQVALDSFSSDIEDVQEVVDELVENTEESLKQSKEEILQLEQAISSTKREVKKNIKEYKDITDKKLELQNEIIEEMEEKVNTIQNPEINFDEIENKIWKKIDKKADKKHRHNVNEIDWLDELVKKDDLKDFAMKSDIKVVWGYTKWVRNIVAWSGIAIDDTDPRNPIINSTGILQLLQSQNFYVDTIVNNQVTEAHREDGTAIVNTYNGNNKLQTAVYTFPDTSTLTLTITYDGNGNVSTALYS